MRKIRTFSQYANESVKDWLLAGALSAASLKSQADTIRTPTETTRKTEQERQVVFPVYVEDQYTVRPGDCDALHAFQSRKVEDKSTGKVRSEVVGNMHAKVTDRLKELHASGYNVKATDVDVTVTGTTVKWKVKIEESTDGKSWVGFTSRGAGCNRDIIYRSTAGGNSMDSVLANVKRTYKETNAEIEAVDDTLYKDPTYGFRQFFYAYTRPDSFPAHRTARTQASQKQATTQPTSTGQTRPQKATAADSVYSKDFDFEPKVLNAIYGFYRGKFEMGQQVRFGGFDISYDKGTNKISTSMTVTPDPDSEWFNFVFVSAPLGDTRSLDRIVSANKEYRPKVVASGRINLPDGNYGWNIVGLRK